MAIGEQGGEGDSQPRTSGERLEGGEFLLRLSHDLRASLRAIRVNAELLAKGLKTGQTANFPQYTSVIVADTARIDTLADALAAYSIASQIDPASFVVISAEMLLRKVLSKLAQDLRDAGASVTYGSLPRLRCEPDQIGRLFEQLIRNVLMHRQAAPPKIHIGADQQAGAWVLSVRDNGPGIEAGYLERIFEPFERLRGQQSPGPGLGLTISREIVRRHGGRIWVESQAGSGACFLFTIPG
ncbi:MAG TPA: ATP-binding protein [Bryobacteraceae bacterium]|nr:ATP-binding protein [Bryobacteraceae bacterium]